MLKTTRPRYSKFTCHNNNNNNKQITKHDQVYFFCLTNINILTQPAMKCILAKRSNPHFQKNITWWTIPDPGGTTSMLLKAFEPHFKNANLSLLRWNSSSIFAWTAFSDLATSTWTEWSITRSTGTCMDNIKLDMACKIWQWKEDMEET